MVNLKGMTPLAFRIQPGHFRASGGHWIVFLPEASHLPAHFPLCGNSLLWYAYGWNRSRQSGYRGRAALQGI